MRGERGMGSTRAARAGTLNRLQEQFSTPW